ncbi:hypothetical protein TcG_05300 [Trypanosoma cruzi]|nr:hypothetical protein TcG_05300 [Trypanosoma cruzi]
MPSLFQSYVLWVRDNAENALSVERFTQLIIRIVTDPRNFMTTEFAWTLAKLHSLSNRMIISTTGRRVGFTEKVAIVIKTLVEIECLLELGLRRFFGHEAAWTVLLALQSIKCVLNMLVHQQLFLVPWIWAAVRQRLQLMLQQFMRLPDYGRRISSAVAEGFSALPATYVSLAPVRSGTVGPANVRLVIPRVALRQTYHSTAAGSGEKENVVKTSESLRCTGIDLLGLLVDLALVLRPLLLLYFSRRAFPYGRTGIATLPVAPMASSHMRSSEKDATPAMNDADDYDGLFLVRAAMSDGVSNSLLSSWGVGLSFFGLDTVLALLSRYIRRHRVPVVYINNSETCDLPEPDVGVKDGEFSSRSNEVNSHSLHQVGNSTSGNHASSNGSSAPLPPLLPRPPTGDVAELAPVLSRDSLRVQQIVRNIAFSFLRDPFFPALLQKFVYEHFVVGRVNRIPVLGPILGFQVAYFLCKQHYCFMYLLE